MRQVDGSDLLGPKDPRNADIGILYVGPEDSRQEILTAINAQELLSRKKIAIVLPEQGKAFRQPVEFDGLKNMRRSLKAQLIFIAPSGPGPAEFARHRRFVVYSSLETFKTALLSEQTLNPRTQAASGNSGKKPNMLGRGKASKERVPNPPPVVPSPAPPTPRIMPATSVQPVMPPTPPTPRITPAQSSGSAGQAKSPVSPIPQTPIEEMDTRTLEFERPGIGPAPVGKGPSMANALDEDDDLAPPVTPRQPQGNAGPDGPSGGAKPQDVRRSPSPLLLGQQTNTPRPGGGSGLPTTSSQGSQTRTGTGKQPAVSGRSAGATQGKGTKKLPTAQSGPDGSAGPKQVSGKNGGSGKVPVVVPVGAPVAGPAPAGGGTASASASPAAATVAASGSPAGPGGGSRQAALTPLPVPRSRRRSRGRKRLLLLLLLLLLTLILVGWIGVNALGGPGSLASLGHLTATVTITPRSQIVQNNYLISGVTSVPDANQRQVSARILTAQSDTKQGTAKATGSIPAARATGSLLFQNSTSTGLTIAGNAQTVLTAGNGVQVTFNEPVFVPATGSASATINDAYALQPGAAGNIPAFAITGPCCVAGISVKNTVAFHGGQDPQANSVIQQGDIDGAAKPLIAQVTQSTQQTLAKEMKGNERVVDGSFKCPATVKPDHNVGDRAPSVTVNVSVSCSEEVFDLAAAQHIASSLLPTNLPNGTNLTGYALVPPIITNLVSDTVVSAQGQVSIQMQAAGRWVYQFDARKQQQIKQALAGRSKADAQGVLRQYAGLASATISISSGSTLPTNPNDITVTIAPVAGLQQGTPTGSAGATPTGPVNTSTGRNTPIPTPTGSPEQGS